MGILQVLILDAFTKDLLAPLLKVSELRRHGVTMHLQLHQDRQPIADAPAIYFVRATSDNIQRIISDGAQVTNPPRTTPTPTSPGCMHTHMHVYACCLSGHCMLMLLVCLGSAQHLQSRKLHGNAE